MGSIDYLIDHATKNVWCNPYMDTPSILKLHRLTGRTGARHQIPVPFGILTLPSATYSYHVFQIGSISDSSLSIEADIDYWTTVADLCMEDSMMVNIYPNSGYDVPRSLTWIRRGANNTLFIAITNAANIPDVITESVYIRFYSNSYRASVRSLAISEFIYVEGGIVQGNTLKLSVLNAFYNRTASGGLSYLFLNGVERGYLLPADVVDGDVLELVYNGAVKNVVDFKVSDLQSFISVVDATSKYILHPPKDGTDTIRYWDDLEIQILTPGVDTRHTAIHYHLNSIKAISQLTHRDYALPTEYVDAYITQNPDIISPAEAYVRIAIKHSGLRRPLYYTGNHINDLYKLPDSKILELLTGVNSTLPEWSAIELEQHSYATAMSTLTPISEITALEAYGYHGVNRLLYDTPLKVVIESGGPEVVLPVGLQHHSTMYEYGPSGELLGMFEHITGGEYYPYQNSTALVECYKGLTSDRLDIQTTLTGKIKPELEYRFYKLITASGPLPERWIDVTGTSDYIVTDQGYRFEITSSTIEVMVISNLTALGYETYIDLNENILKLQLTTSILVDFIYTEIPLPVPLGKIDVWLNNHPLIRDIDFFVSSTQEVVITNKEFVVGNELQRVRVRGEGFATADFKPSIKTERGFIAHGKLSRNNKYDVRDDRITRCIVGGKLVDRSQLSFSEEGTVEITGFPDGTPYILEYPVMSLRDLGSVAPSNFISKALTMDDRVSNLLTMELPEASIGDAVFISKAYTLYSPLISQIYSDVTTGRLTLPPVQNDEYVRLACAPYLELLNVDPAALPDLDTRYIAVQPHPFTEVRPVTLTLYSFLNRVSVLYLNNRVDLSQFVTIGV